MLKAYTNLKAHAKYVLFFISNYFRCNFGPNCFEGPCLFLSFCSDTLYILVFVFNKRTFGILIKFGESFSLDSLLNQYQTHQGNPYGVYPDLSSFTGSDVIQNFVACIKRSTPSKDHIKYCMGVVQLPYLIILVTFHSQN